MTTKPAVKKTDDVLTEIKVLKEKLADALAENDALRSQAKKDEVSDHQDDRIARLEVENARLRAFIQKSITDASLNYTEANEVLARK